MVLGRKKEEEVEIPEQVLATIAEHFFKQYGENIARFINERISERFKTIETKLDATEYKIQKLEAMSNERIKDMVKSILEVQMENIANKSAEKAVSSLGIEKIKVLEEEINNLRQAQMEITESIENLANIVGKQERAIADHNSNMDKINAELEKMKGQLSKAVEFFNDEVRKAVAGATKEIREAVMVDRSKIEVILGDVVTKVVNAKMRDVVDEFTQITEKYEEMSQNIGRIIDLAEGIELVSSRLSAIEKEIQDLKDRISSLGTASSISEAYSEDDLSSLAKETKEFHDGEEKEIEEEDFL